MPMPGRPGVTLVAMGMATHCRHVQDLLDFLPKSVTTTAFADADKLYRANTGGGGG
jgi:hypothetical protein